jgi:hypothetical protein
MSKTTTPTLRPHDVVILCLMSFFCLIFIVIFVVAIVRATNPGVTLNLQLRDYSENISTAVLGTRSSAKSSTVSAPGGSLAPQTITSLYVAEFTSSDFYNWKDDNGDKLLNSTLDGALIEVDRSIVRKENGLYINNKGADSINGTCLRFPPVSFFNNEKDILTITLRLDTTVHKDDQFIQASIVFSSNFNGVNVNTSPEALQEASNFVLVFQKVQSQAALMLMSSSKQIASLILSTVPEALEITITMTDDTATINAYEFGKTAEIGSATGSDLGLTTAAINMLYIVTERLRLFHFSINGTNTTSKDEGFVVKSTSCYTASFDSPSSTGGPPSATRTMPTFTKYNGKDVLPANSNSVILIPLPTTIVPNGHRLFVNNKKTLMSLGDVIEVSVPLSHPVLNAMIILATVDDFSTQGIMTSLGKSNKITVNVGSIGSFMITDGNTMYMTNSALSYSDIEVTGTIVFTIDLCQQKAKVQLVNDAYVSDIIDIALPTFNAVCIKGFDNGTFGDVSVKKYLKMESASTEN